MPTPRLLLIAALAGCTPPEEPGDTATPPMDLGSDAARIFAINPLATPEPEDVVLPWVADDQGGTLASEEDEAGVRRLRVFSCVDEGETEWVMGYGTLRVCTLRQRANKDADGDFTYEDWDAAVEGSYDPDDVHAEVSLYWHASRAYDLVTAPEVGLYDRLPVIHEAGGEVVPLNLVANYHAPSLGEDTPLAPTAQAFHLTDAYLQLGMDAFSGLLGFRGDVLAFGQGEQADFAYDGETVYHEFGHVVTWSVGGLQYDVGADEQGQHNLTPSLEQGVTETLVSVLSGRTALFDYIDQTTVTGGYARDLDNDDVYPETMGGISPYDGMVVAAAHHDLWLHLQGAAGLDLYGFTRLLLLALEANVEPDLDHSFHRWAEVLLDSMEAEGLHDHVEEARAILEQRGLFETLRARSLEGLLAGDAYLVVGGAAQAAWNSWLDAEIEGEDTALATAAVQTWTELEATTTRLEIEASLMTMSGEMASDPTDWDPLLLLRAGEPVHYDHTDGRTTITADAVVAPELDKSGDTATATWTLEALEPGQRLYLHVVNRGDASFVMFLQSVTAG